MNLTIFKKYLNAEILRNFLRWNKKIFVSGVNSTFLSFYSIILNNETDKKIIIIVPDIDTAIGMFYELNSIQNNSAYIITNQIKNEDYSYFNSLSKLFSSESKNIFILTYTDLSLKVPDKNIFKINTLNLRIHQKVDMTNFIKILIESGYERVDNVYNQGEFSVRGNIIDVFSYNNLDAVRIELFDDEIESIRFFKVENQRSFELLDNIEIIPNKFSEINNNQKILVDYLEDENLLKILFEFEKYNYDGNLFFINQFIENKCLIRFSEKFLNLYSDEIIHLSINKKPFIDYTNNSLSNKINLLIKNYSKIILSAKFDKQLDRLHKIFFENKISGLEVLTDLDSIEEKNFKLGLINLTLNNSLYFESENILIIPEEQLYVQEQLKYSFQLETQRYKPIHKFNELNENDYVVHWDYGIGIYKGLKTLNIEGVDKDFLHIQYANESELYLPPAEFKHLSKYINFDENRAVELSDLNKKKWNNIKLRAKQKIDDIAYELIELYSGRLNSVGYKFSEDTAEQMIFESKFSYEETRDQLKAISDVKKDMESAKCMDRLICGDVGYGKTEVAIRAAFKSAMNKKQVAILVPTTVLCLQHFDTFLNRFAGVNIKVEMLSRFRPQSIQREIISKLKIGEIDVIIGTHRLLQDDVYFKNLGLLIIDEEQRFGVKHKEKLKLLRRNVDVLTLTATPIPRTLHLSLSGLRDISLIQTHPKNRVPIKTIVAKYDETIIKKAILFEINRGGQIFFLHNNINTLEVLAVKLKNLVPHLRLKIAHGKMKPVELEKVMFEFYNNDFELLLCTTIIENGLDIPTVNTIIINNAENFGLAQLHQLRGRVGRSNIQAFAYLLHSGIEAIGENAKKRLTALQEYVELGSGYDIAMKDLQIRGAGNILGEEQSGVIVDIGYDLYCQILKETLESMRKDNVDEKSVIVEYNISAFIPVNYIVDAMSRIEFYKKILNAENYDDINNLIDELEDRFGTLPEPLKHLVEIGTLKMAARGKNIREITINKKETIIEFDNPPIKKMFELKKKKKGFNFTGYGKKPNSIVFGPYINILDMFKDVKDFLNKI